MKLKVSGLEYGRVTLNGSGFEINISKRNKHIKDMDLQEGDFVEMTLKKVVNKSKPVKKKAKKKKMKGGAK